MAQRRTTRLEQLFIDPLHSTEPMPPSSPSADDADDDDDNDDDDDDEPPSPIHPTAHRADDPESGIIIRGGSGGRRPSPVCSVGRPHKSLTPDIIMQTGDFANVLGGIVNGGGGPFMRSFSVDGGAAAQKMQDQQHKTANGGGGATIDSSIATSATDSERLGAFSRSHGNVRRWSQTMLRGALRNGKQTIREKTINFMPSRLNMQLDGDDDGDDDDVGDGGGGGETDEVGSEVDRLTQEIEQHEHLMDLTAQSEQQRIETLRSLPKPLAIKREIKSKLSTTITNKSAQRPIGTARRWRYALAMWINRTEQSTSRTIINLELWYGRLKRIEGNCGSAVGTYFKFLRSLFVMNVVLAIVSLGFVVVPQCLYNSMHPAVAAASSEAEVEVEESAFYFADLFTAQGFMAGSVVFYGAYTPHTLNMTAQHFYSVPHAYFLTMTSLYIVTFLVVSIIVARSYRRSFIETAVGALPNLYAQRLFAAWDFSITSHKAAHLKHNQIYNELREVLADIKQPAPALRRWQRAARWCMQACVHAVVAATMAAIGYGMWLLLQLIDAERSDRSRLSSMYVAVAACGTLVAMQTVFGWVAAAERYDSGRTRLHVTLLRCYVLELMLGGVLLVFWLTRSGAERCWETNVGQEIYRLVVVDFVVFVLGGLVWNAGRWAVWRWLWPGVGLPEFDIARGSLGLVFNQSLLWMGMLFAPALAALMVVKMAVTFYVKEVSLMCFCRPATSMWRSAQTATLFLVMVFVSLLAVMTTNGYIITRIPVSADCGPFQQYEFMMQMFVNDVLQLQEDHLFWRLFLLLTKPAFIGGVLVFMAAITYYMRAKSKSNIGMVKILKDMLAMEGADKDFLLTEITRLTHGRDAMFALTPQREMKSKTPPSTTTTTATPMTDSVRWRRSGGVGNGDANPVLGGRRSPDEVDESDSGRGAGGAA